MPEDEKVVLRTSLTFTQETLEKLRLMERKQHRSLASLIVEACDFFVYEKPILEAENLARKSPEYQAIISEAQKKYGSPRVQE